MERIKQGDVVKLFNKYEDSAKLALVIQINKSEFLGEGGWITFDYVVLNEFGELVNISSCCVEKIIHSNQSPATWLNSNYSSD